MGVSLASHGRGQTVLVPGPPTEGPSSPVRPYHPVVSLSGVSPSYLFLGA